MRHRNLAKDAPEYGDGFLFSNASLESPNLAERTWPFRQRAEEIEKHCQETVDPSVKIRMDWEWNVKSGKWFPFIEISWHGSDYNSLIFEIDYCYKIFQSREKELINNSISDALKSLIAIKSM